jgi:hypothetical protein
LTLARINRRQIALDTGVFRLSIMLAMRQMSISDIHATKASRDPTIRDRKAPEHACDIRAEQARQRRCSPIRGARMSHKQPLPTGRQLSALDPVCRERPHEYLDRLRAKDPIHRDAEVGRLFLTRFEDVKAVLSEMPRRNRNPARTAPVPRRWPTRPWTPRRKGTVIVLAK